ncbi:TetR/AcrR family transcriptional regulator [Stackebrandtia nassauensis]|uniref:Transcriptional regulator, TetR family n=1 Tax=Stackebrandtia nassauensis (strain DSM 44728 / CIP 108903 / NRRL B-16338 / NBRC 102104 / LLR-40K-21) TaxID=446470 RepID=D3Q6C2_STANL|nr:TetR/AcrR family transcriptional regulator [Stackebrandtia nassauensis]ADD42297.1 transcriptional regulator, TetR family [Stackebrandtia nassauensis DSM 44728]
MPHAHTSPTSDDNKSLRQRRTAKRREDILRAATEIFGNRGYKSGSLTEIAEQVGMTHAGILHHFGSKNQLLLAVLDYRDEADVQDLEGKHPPEGMDLFKHLVDTARLNSTRPGIVQTYAVLSADSVTDNHPAQDYFRDRFTELRAMIARSLSQICEPDAMPSSAALDTAASAIIGVMDGLQVQWLLDDINVDLPHATAFAIDAILAALVAGRTGSRLESDS